MRFAHLSDLHLCDGPTADADASRHATAITSSIAASLARISDILDFIVVSGDLTDDAHGLSFATFERLFRPLELPVFTIPGNHDGPAAYRHEVESGWLAACDITNRTVELAGLRLLGLDSCIENTTTGALAETALESVQRELTASDPRPLVIVMHHPPFPTGHEAFDAIAATEGTAHLGRLLIDCSRAPIILCGHVHRIYQAHWRGAACYIAGSPTLPFTSTQPFGPSPLHPAAEVCTYFIHAIGDDGTHVVTPQYVK